MNDNLKPNPLLELEYQQLSEVAGYLWERGWAERNAGNISLNITELVTDEIIYEPDKQRIVHLDETYSALAGNSFLVTCTGSRMRDLARSPRENSVIIRIDDNGSSYKLILLADENSGIKSPTSELITHLGIHNLIAKRGTHEKVILHAHATELIALTQYPDHKSVESLNHVLWGMHPETMIFVPEGIGFVPYTLPGSEVIAKQSIRSFEQHDIVVWEKHGVFSIGLTLSDTFDKIDILCKAAKIYFLCSGAGFVPEGLSLSQLDELKTLSKKFNAG
jgi:rhamnulose-1-phosphate aldolase